MLVPIVSVLCFIKDFKVIAPTSALANVLILYGIIVVLYFFATVWDEREDRCK
jgi:amino acid permease